MSKNQSRLLAIAFVFILTNGAVVVNIPFVNAQEVPVYAFLIVSPNPVGINQAVSVSFFLDTVPPTAVVSEVTDGKATN